MKRQLFYLAVLCATAYGCHNNNSVDQMLAKLDKPDTLRKQMIIHDRSAYSATFIDSLKKTNYPGSIKLDSNYILVGKDTTYFPETLKLDSPYQFIADKDAVHYNLTLQRTNLTDILFNFEVSKEQSSVYNRKGSVSLGPLFFLATEVPEDETTGDSYGAYSYTQYSTPNPFTVDIGTDEDEHHHLRATVHIAGKNPLLEKIPTLRTK